MSYHISMPEAGVFFLENINEGTKVEIFQRGAIVNAFLFTGFDNQVFNCIDGLRHPSEIDSNTWFKNVKMSPFVCRLSNASFEFEGCFYSGCGRSFDNDHSIHGLLYDAEFVVIESICREDGAYLILQTVWNSTDFFPFPYEVTVTYHLENSRSLLVKTTVKNTGVRNMPLSDGWHPYFNLSAPLDDCSINMGVLAKMKFNETMIPTGAWLDAGPYSGGMSLSRVHFDDCFLLHGINNEHVCEVKGPYYAVRIIADTSYPYLQLFTPNHRQSIAIENLSSIPDAFNNGIGRLLLQPGQSQIFQTTWQVHLPDYTN